MLKAYKVLSENAEGTQNIAREFARVCETLRAKTEVWGISLYGMPFIGKSTFSVAFGAAVVRGHGIEMPSVSEEMSKMRDFINNKLKKQVRCGDYAAGELSYANKSSFLKDRRAGFGGYDVLEHAPEEFYKIAEIGMALSRGDRQLVFKVEEKLWAAPVFKSAMKKLGAQEALTKG